MKRLLNHPRMRHHVGITAACGLYTAFHYWAPADWQAFSPLAGFFASLLWIWSD